MTSNPLATVLNVDDHEATRYARNRVLRAAGYNVIDATTGAETFAAMEHAHADLVLLDVHLPDMNGIDVCRQLKAQASDRSVIVIQISASAVTASHATRSLDAGADAYLVEPVEPEVLLATVNAMMRLHHAERSLTEAKRQLEEMNQELRRSNEDLQQFAFAASHDLQEPLRTITTFTQLIDSELRDVFTEQQKEYFNHITGAAGRMRILIRDLLAYSRVGREERPREIVELEKVVSWAVANLDEQMKDLNGRVEVTKPLPSVFGDFAHLGLVFQNLISNSLKYRKPEAPPYIHVQAFPSSKTEWTISFADNGIGIAPKYRDQVFGPFKRLHGPEIPGTGIGLALCRRVIESHGGRIWIDPASANGTTFLMTLSPVS